MSPSFNFKLEVNKDFLRFLGFIKCKTLKIPSNSNEYSSILDNIKPPSFDIAGIKLFKLFPLIFKSATIDASAIISRMFAAKASIGFKCNLLFSCLELATSSFINISS